VTHDSRIQDVLEALLVASEERTVRKSAAPPRKGEDIHVDVTQADIDRAVGEFYAREDENGVHLTEAGLKIAKGILRRHRLTEMLLFSVLGLERELASEIACRVEHSIREEMLEGVCTLLGHPATCPHGRPIPPGECCSEDKRTVSAAVHPLTDLAPGELGRVIYLTPSKHERLHKLSALGLIPGVIIELHRKFPVYCMRFDETEVAVEPKVASEIFVSKIARRDDSERG
jgi:DtxR family Mn-dependent transcriptional regulator